MHRESRYRNLTYVYNSRTDHTGPGNAAVLCQIVMKGANARQGLRHETVFAAERISRGHRVAALEHLIDAESGLIGVVPFVSDVGEVVAIDAGAHYRRRSHHRHAATDHAHIHVWPGRVFPQE